ncbi:hypothetical protein Tco_0772832 [Tanacetum coccineum]|uniref:Uncharacterized protein n=1 Tax=Tanacetum coccineum TaxID=301880 RepID=A0ABQ4ZLL4_9ASTR
MAAPTLILGYTRTVAIWKKNLGYSEWSTPTGLKLARENLQSRVKEEDSITDVENAVFDLGFELNFPVSTQRSLRSKLVWLKGQKGGSAAEIFALFYSTDNDIKFLEQQNPPEQSWLSILLSKQVLESSVCIGGSAWVLRCPRTAPTAKSLASHMISKGKSQSGATRIGAWVNFILRVSNASMHSFEKINGSSFFKEGGYTAGVCLSITTLKSRIASSCLRVILFTWKHRSRPCRPLKKGLPKFRELSGSANVIHTAHKIRQVKKNVPTFKENILGDARGWRVEIVRVGKFKISFGFRSTAGEDLVLSHMRERIWIVVPDAPSWPYKAYALFHLWKITPGGAVHESLVLEMEIPQWMLLGRDPEARSRAGNTIYEFGDSVLDTPGAGGLEHDLVVQQKFVGLAVVDVYGLENECACTK